MCACSSPGIHHQTVIPHARGGPDTRVVWLVPYAVCPVFLPLEVLQLKTPVVLYNRLSQEFHGPQE